MSESIPRAGVDRWDLAQHAAALLAIDRVGLGGAILRGSDVRSREAWLASLREMLALSVAWRKMPSQITESRLLGGLDLAATLAAGTPVAERGLLAEADGAILIVPMAERLAGQAASQLGAVLDNGEIVVERDGIAARVATKPTVILFDEGLEDERAPASLAERLAFRVELDGLRPDGPSLRTQDDIAAAQLVVAAVRAPDEAIEALSVAALAFGVFSLRVATLALRAAKAAAALSGRDEIGSEDVELAAALVIAPRATRLPSDDVAEPAESELPEAERSEPSSDNSSDAPQDPAEAQPMADRVLDAVHAAIPDDLFALLAAAAAGSRQSAAPGRGGQPHQGGRRGRPAGVRRGVPGHGARLALVETLRAAAPWQVLRRRVADAKQATRVFVRREDFRVGRFKQKRETTTIFVVDASGSSALHRLAEVKGAVELVLADCYVRRDSVALIAFRGERAELVLPPTRSLVRAKRALAGLPGGGGTPLAAAIDAAGLIASAARARGQEPLVVLLTDGKANVSRTGRPGRAEAEADVAAAARMFRFGAAPGLVLDTGPRPGEGALRLAEAMGARYIPLPYADAQAMSRAVLVTGRAS